MAEKSSLNKITPFLITVTVYLIFLAVLVIVFGYKDSFLMLNGGRYSWLDWPMFIMTHLGDSLILASLLSIILVWKHPQTVINLIVIVILSGLFGQVMKMTLFDGWDRPLRVFDESPLVHTLPNYRLFHNSFPSGHSITSMAAFTTVILGIRPQRKYQLSIALLAVLITYTRIYLGVHFPGDVLAGSLIGITSSLLLVPLLNRWLNTHTYTRNFKIGISILATILLLTGIVLVATF